MKRFGQKRLNVILIVILLVTAVLSLTEKGYAASLTTFSSGQTISSAAVNNNFTALNNEIAAFAGGVEYAALTSYAGLTTTVTNLLSVSVAAPGAGYIIVFFSGNAIFFGDATVIEAGISTLNNSVGSYYARVGRLDGTGTLRYVEPFTTQYIFYVSTAGTYVYYANAVKESVFGTNTVNLSSLWLSAIFVPKRY